jgi:transketolase
MQKNSKEIEKITKFSKNLRKKILLMAYCAGSSAAHIGGALSIAEIVSVLYGAVMNFDGNLKEINNRDRFILSKGHACLALYAALNLRGLITDKELLSFEKKNSPLLGHPVINQEKGIEFSTGSLGMGLSLGIGTAIGFKKKNETKRKVYVIIGDGECNEGSIWESAMAAPNFYLDNMIVILDKNNFQQTGSNSEIMRNELLKSKWENFGWNCYEIDGHNLKELLDTLRLIENNGKPKFIIANTIKGKGIHFTENNNQWHHSILTKSKYEEAIKQLNDE